MIDQVAQVIAHGVGLTLHEEFSTNENNYTHYVIIKLNKLLKTELQYLIRTADLLWSTWNKLKTIKACISTFNNIMKYFIEKFY